MPNRLKGANSPYLIQHANNPVDWYEWGNEALQMAHQEDKPIFLSIGYAACHWCHVMAHESFEDENTAQVMNQNFINIKVDREERPDIDSIYMNAVVALTGSGGWPMSVFLTPDGKPFYGGTYFPPTPRHNLPSFINVLLNIARAWKEEKQKVLQAADQITENALQAPELSAPSVELSLDKLDQASMRLAQSYDWKFGGWGTAPKFPQPMAIDFLLRRASRGDKFALQVATHSLDSMARGGMYDVIGGGFARYSTDNNWLVPHFEKMLYDNAQLARVYLHAYLLTKEVKYRRVCEETINFVIREITHEKGGFFSSLDADSNGEEGQYYLWTYEELKKSLPDPEDFQLLTTAYGISGKGNFEGKIILQQEEEDVDIAKRIDLKVEEVREQLNRIHASLLNVREQRPKPGIDDKVLVSWNAMVSIVLSEAGRYLGDSSFLEMAIRNMKFLIDELFVDNRLRRCWRNGIPSQNAFLEDYAALSMALISLYESDPSPIWYRTSELLLMQMIEHFKDPEGGFFDTSDIQESLIVRPKDLQDNAVPSGNALAATALLHFSALSGNDYFRKLCEEMMGSVYESVTRYPLGFSQWLCAMDFALNPSNEVAIVGDPNDARTRDLISTIWSTYRPNLVAAISDFPIPPSSPPLLENRSLLNNLPTAYVCRSFTCRQPVNDARELSHQLEGL